MDRDQTFGALVLIIAITALLFGGLFCHVYSIALPDSQAIPIAIIGAVVVVALSWIGWSRITRIAPHEAE